MQIYLSNWIMLLFAQYIGGKAYWSNIALRNQMQQFQPITLCEWLGVVSGGRAVWSLICGNTTKPHDSWFEVHMALLTQSIRMIYFPQSSRSCNIRALHSHRQRTGGCMVVDHMAKPKSLPEECGIGQLLLSWVTHHTAPARVRASSGEQCCFQTVAEVCSTVAASPLWLLTGKFPKHLHPAMLHACIHRGPRGFIWVIWKVKPAKCMFSKRLTINFR